MNEIVPKPWGYEYCAFDNGKAAVWILHIGRGRKTSRHMHPKKRTRLIPLQGEVVIRTDAEYRSGPLQVHDIRAGVYHETSVMSVETAAMNGAFLMEIEEPSDKGDIVRADDAYGRAGKPIESATVPCGTEMLRISHRAQSIMGYTFKLESTLGGATPDLLLEVGGEVLGIYREKTKRLADCVADFVKSLGIKHVFGVTGGGSMHLNDAFREVFIANHHEQASAFAADAYSRAAGLGCALVTTGPGGTNAVTGVAASWVDSIPVLFISGQVTRESLMDESGLRQRGIQESDIATLVSSITKYAATVKHESAIRWELEKAVHLARSGRPGPVWIDIPLDIQSKQVCWDELEPFRPVSESVGIQKFEIALPAKRPVLVIGNGVHLAGAEEDCRRLVREWNIPVVSSWAAADIIPTDDELYIGRFGIFGDRAANFAVQNADLLIVLGSRLSIPQTGYRLEHFARGARIVMVDVDEAEARKFPNSSYFLADVRTFIAGVSNPEFECSAWRALCQEWKNRYPVPTDSGSFKFISELSERLPDDAVVVTDMGTSFTCTFQTARMKLGQRWFTASGHAPMGYGLPGAIGAHYATGKRVTCIVGDGAIMFNLQELQTIAEHRLPIDIYVLANGGYLTMKHTQENHFGRRVGADFAFPDFKRLGEVFGVEINVVEMDPMQPLTPRSSSVKLPDGSITSRPIEDLYPFLPREEFRAQMIVPTVEAMG